MNWFLPLFTLVGLLAAAAAGRAGGPFTDESKIIAVARDDQADDLKIGRLLKEVTLTAAVKVLTTYQVVTYERYISYAHQSGAYGTVTVKDRGTCLWDIELDYAAVVTLPGGRQVYLLRPGLGAPKTKGK